MYFSLPKFHAQISSIHNAPTIAQPHLIFSFCLPDGHEKAEHTAKSQGQIYLGNKPFCEIDRKCSVMIQNSIRPILPERVLHDIWGYLALGRQNFTPTLTEIIDLSMGHHLCLWCFFISYNRGGPKGVSTKGVSMKRPTFPNFRAFLYSSF